MVFGASARTRGTSGWSPGSKQRAHPVAVDTELTAEREIGGPEEFDHAGARQAIGAVCGNQPGPAAAVPVFPAQPAARRLDRADARLEGH